MASPRCVPTSVNELVSSSIFLLSLCVFLHVYVLTWRSEDSFQDSSAPFHPVGFRGQTQVERFGSKHFHPVSHLSSSISVSYIGLAWVEILNYICVNSLMLVERDGLVGKNTRYSSIRT